MAQPQTNPLAPVDEEVPEFETLAVPPSDKGLNSGPNPLAPAGEEAKKGAPGGTQFGGGDAKVVDLYWFEKISIIFTYLQLFSLLHTFSVSYFPSPFLQTTALVTLSTLDLTTLTHYLSPSAPKWISYHGSNGWSPFYTLVLNMVPFTLVWLLRYKNSNIYAKGSPNIGEKRISYMLLKSRIHVFLQYFQLPVLIATSRLWRCENVTRVVEVTWEIEYAHFRGLKSEPSFECAGGGYYFYLSVCSLLCIVSNAYLMRSNYLAISDYDIYNNSLDYEKSCLGCEICKIFELSENWDDGQWLNKIYRFRYRYYDLIKSVVFVLTVLPYCLNSTDLFKYLWGSDDEDFLQIMSVVSFFVVVSGYFLLCVNMVGRPFVSPSSNGVNLVFSVCLIVTNGVLLATAQGIRTAFTLPTRSNQQLRFVNGMGLVVAFVMVMFFSGLFRKGGARGEGREVEGVLKKIFARGRENSGGNGTFDKFIDAVRNARSTLEKCHASEPSMAPLHHLEDDMRKLRNCLLAQLKNRSILAIITNDLLDECAEYHSRSRKTSLLPGKALGETLDANASDLVLRRKFLVLQTPKKRRVMLKLLAVRFLVGNRKIKSLTTWETEILEDAKKLIFEYRKLFGKGLKSSDAFGEKFLKKVDNLGDAWKLLLKHWESKYKENVFRKPTKEDKNEKKEWYELYKRSRKNYELLEARLPFGGGMTLKWAEGMEALVKRWGVLKRDVWGDGVAVDFEEVGGEVKEGIRVFENAWEKTFGGEEISVEEKKEFEGVFYEVYSDIKEAKKVVKHWSDKAANLEKKWGEFKLSTIYSEVIEKGVEKKVAKIEAGWKALIRDWVDKWKARVGEEGKEMTSELKRERVGWYTKYGEARSKLKELKQGKKDLEHTVKETKEALGGGAQLSKSKVVKLKTKWKKHIRAWEKQWIVQNNGVKSREADKAGGDVEKWFGFYKKLGELDIEMNRKALEMGDDMTL
ncbi:hypothetical protein TrVE_jg2637 [Triparma verrucosa]|uniref:Uncharacterized protein n=1 Tax=Triparma verrucosa TaxID=1606542 RepID=A0A9W7EQB2_9STRA|nr:hypothetical protein TrVE_jg2637 [Triparma verrucosa]